MTWHACLSLPPVRGAAGKRRPHRLRGATAALALALALSAPAGAEHQIRCENPAVFTPTISFYNALDCHIARYPIPGCNVKTDPHVCTKRGTGITYDIACPRSGANDPLRESWVAEAWRQFTAFYSLTPCPAIEHGESRVGGESSSSGGGGSNESGGSDSSESGGGGSNESGGGGGSESGGGGGSESGKSGGGGGSESGKSGAGSFGGAAGLGLALLVLGRRPRALACKPINAARKRCDWGEEAAQ